RPHEDDAHQDECVAKRLDRVHVAPPLLSERRGEIPDGHRPSRRASPKLHCWLGPPWHRHSCTRPPLARASKSGPWTSRHLPLALARARPRPPERGCGATGGGAATTRHSHTDCRPGTVVHHCPAQRAGAAHTPGHLRRASSWFQIGPASRTTFCSGGG